MPFEKVVCLRCTTFVVVESKSLGTVEMMGGSMTSL